VGVGILFLIVFHHTHLINNFNNLNEQQIRTPLSVNPCPSFDSQSLAKNIDMCEKNDEFFEKTTLICRTFSKLFLSDSVLPPAGAKLASRDWPDAEITILASSGP
jgi:hypothetical protein